MLRAPAEVEEEEEDDNDDDDDEGVGTAVEEVAVTVAGFATGAETFFPSKVAVAAGTVFFSVVAAGREEEDTTADGIFASLSLLLSFVLEVGTAAVAGVGAAEEEEGAVAGASNSVSPNSSSSKAA